MPEVLAALLLLRQVKYQCIFMQQNYRPITGCQQSLFVFNGDFGGFQWGNGPILNIMLEIGLNMIDLVITHLTHPWGPS